jgi:hypothetical protein
VPVSVLLAAGVVLAWQHGPLQRLVRRPLSTERTVPWPTQFTIRPRIDDRKAASDTAIVSGKRHPRIGSVLVPQGELERLSAGEAQWKPIESGMPVRLGDTLRTGENADASVVFLDGSINWLAHNTTLSYTGTARSALRRPDLVRLSRGETWNQVEAGGPTFAVETPAARAIVHGTAFTVALGPKGETRLKVQKGQVELRTAVAAVMVPAGMQSVALPGQAPQSAIRTVPASTPPVARAHTDKGAPAGKPRIQFPPPPGRVPETDAPGNGELTHPSGVAPNPSLPQKAVTDEGASEPPGAPASSSGVDDGGKRLPITTGP